MVIRQSYLNQIIPLIDKNLIKVLVGVRRAGKTVLLEQVRDYLLQNGRAEKQIIFVNFESKRHDRLRNADALYAYLMQASQSCGGRAYIFLDEIQTVDRWEEVASSLLVDIPCDIYISGSNSKLLSGELATLIAGRYIQIHVYPLTLAEAKQLAIQNGKFTTNEQLFSDYLRYGGLPMRFSLEEISVEPYLTDTYNSIVIKDIVQRNRIHDPDLLNLLLGFLMDNVGGTFSARSIVRALESGGIKTTVETVMAYVGYVKSAMIMHTARRYDIKGKKLLGTGEKYYCIDLGLRNITKTNKQVDFSRLYENIVFLELLARGFEVAVGKTDQYEIDFIAHKGKQRIYVQVCYLLASPETVEREFGNLLRQKDNYPKYVISADLPDFSQDGIKHLNIIDFLLNKPTLT